MHSQQQTQTNVIKITQLLISQNNIKTIKFFNWQNKFLESFLEKREKTNSYRWRDGNFDSFNHTFNQFGGMIIPITCMAIQVYSGSAGVNTC